VKLHVKLNHSGYLPSFAVITNGNIHEQKAAPSVPLEKGDVVVFDRAYNSLLWLRTLDNKGVFFVTRLKKNACYQVAQIYKERWQIELFFFHQHAKDPPEVQLTLGFG
jgi:putative transposase